MKNANDISVTDSVYKDLFGREIKEGDYIVYSAVDGRSATMRTGRVLKLTTAKPSKWSSNEKLEPKILVASWSNFRATGWRDDDERSGRQKDVTLSFFDRMIVINEDQISDKIKQDLAGPVTDWSGKPIEPKENK